MQIITADQSRQARRELGLSQADVAEATGLKRQYLSEFESETAQRFTATQLRKLRTFYEGKLAEANAAGEQIDLIFGEVGSGTETPVPAGSIESVKTKRFFFPVADEVSADTLASTQATIRANDKRLSELLVKTAKREDGLFGQGDYVEEVLQAMRDCYALLAANYLLVRAVGGWPEIDLAASVEKLTGNNLLTAIIDNQRDTFAQAGLFSAPANDADADVVTETTE